jgi:4-aminobutyrate aminotransferase-like enzyme
VSEVSRHGSRPEHAERVRTAPAFLARSRSASATKEPAAAEASSVVSLARERGLMLMGAGIYSNVVRIVVPLVVTDEDLQTRLDIFDGCLSTV